MILKKKEQKKGQLIMATRIIQSENKSATGIPKIKKKDIAGWLREDIAYVDRLIDICASLDERNIAEAIICEKQIPDAEKCFWWMGLPIAWGTYFDFLQEKKTKDELDAWIEFVFDKADDYGVTKDAILEMLSCFVKRLLITISDIQDEDLFTMDVVLEMAGLEISNDDFFYLYVQLIQDGKYIWNED